MSRHLHKIKKTCNKQIYIDLQRNSRHRPHSFELHKLPISKIIQGVATRTVNGCSFKMVFFLHFGKRCYSIKFENKKYFKFPGIFIWGVFDTLPHYFNSNSLYS